jgi:uncharacterized protein with HEPN domain
MTEHRLTEYLDHLHEAASQVRGYIEGMDKDTFLADRRTEQAVILNLIILGEAATKLLQRSRPFSTHTRTYRGGI